MRFRFIAAEKANYPVTLMCRILNASTSGFYAWSKRPESARSRSDRALVVDIKSAHRASRGNYGSPRVRRALVAQGHTVGRDRVARLMRENSLRGKRRRRFRNTTDSNHTHPVAPNVLERQFTTKQPNAAWVGDITYIWPLEGWLYLAVILDLYSRRLRDIAVLQGSLPALVSYQPVAKLALPETRHPGAALTRVPMLGGICGGPALPSDAPDRLAEDEPHLRLAGTIDDSPDNLSSSTIHSISGQVYLELKVGVTSTDYVFRESLSPAFNKFKQAG